MATTILKDGGNYGVPQWIGQAQPAGQSRQPQNYLAQKACRGKTTLSDNVFQNVIANVPSSPGCGTVAFSCIFYLPTIRVELT